MIIIQHSKNQIKLIGHAEYAPIGKDIVCAAVSALLQTFIESVDKLTEDKIKCDISAGKAVIEYENPSERMKLLIDSFFVGVRMIAEEYPQNVKLTEP